MNRSSLRGLSGFTTPSEGQNENTVSFFPSAGGGKPSTKGFTLIELLVVIAIIGILSAVVLASLNTARAKGNDASIKSNLATIRTQSAIYYDANNGYTTNVSLAAAGPTQAACATAATVLTDPKVKDAISSADKSSGGAGNATPTNVKCAINSYANGATWVVYAPLTNNSPTTNTGWCIDSRGISKADVVPTAYACL